MKKVTFIVIMTTLLLITIPATTNAQDIKAQESNPELVVPPVVVSNTEQEDAAKLRLEEIKAIDKSELSSSERKELRKEVKAIKRSSSNNGIYLSTGAIILIVVLIILL